VSPAEAPTAPSGGTGPAVPTTAGAGPAQATAGPAAQAGAAGTGPAGATGGRRRRGGLWWHRDFRLLWIGQTTSRLGSSVTGVALPLVAVTTLGASIWQVALLTGAAWLPWVVIGLPAGAWVDRLPRRRVMVICDVISLLLFLSVPVAAWSGVLTVGYLLAVALGAGTASVFFQTAYQVYLPTLLTGAEVAEGNAKVQGTEAAAQIAGPGIAGLIAQLAGAAAALLVDAASFAVSAICVLAIRAREPHPAPGRRPTTLRREIGAGIRFLARDPYLRVLTVFGACSNVGLIGYQAILVVFLVRDVGVAPATVGGLVAAMGLGGVLGAAIATTVARRIGTARGLILFELLAAPCGLLTPLAGPGPRAALAAASGLIIATGVTVGNVLKNSFRQTYTPHHLLGRVTASMQLVNYGTIPLGALLSGALGTALGARPTMWIMTGGLATTGLILLLGPLRRRRNLPGRPAPVPGPAG
jgi:predicted MFS family arabinose efflux permease